MKKHRLQVGDVLQAKFTVNFPDKVTEGEKYEVTDILEFTNQSFFKIRNDEGESIMPVSASFRIVDTKK